MAVTMCRWRLCVDVLLHCCCTITCNRHAQHALELCGVLRLSCMQQA